MKIHFVASKAFVKNNSRVCRHLLLTINKYSKVTVDWVKGLKVGGTEASPEAIYRGEVKHIKASDGVIAEISCGSLGVGYQISYAIANKKPTLCLYDEEHAGSAVSKLITGSTEKMLYLAKYNCRDLHSLEVPIEEFLKKIKNFSFSKFNFIATQEIKKYIEWGSARSGVSQSEYLRGLIKEIIAKDKDYKKTNYGGKQ